MNQGTGVTDDARARGVCSRFHGPPQDIGEGGFETGTQCEENADPSPHFDPPGIRLDQAVELLDLGGFAGTVSLDQAEAFAAFEFEGDVIDGEELAGAKGALRGF